MKPQVEIIEFKNPTTQRLYIKNIEWDDSEASLIDLIKSKISEYGLVHSIIAKNVENEGNWYAYVDMYSPRAINKVYRASLSKNFFIQHSKSEKVSKVKGRRTDLPLAKEKCETLANFYLGFNGWTSTLMYHQHQSSEILGCNDKLTLESTNNFDSGSRKIKKRNNDEPIMNKTVKTEKYASAVRLKLPNIQNGELSVEGVGVGTSNWNINCPDGKGRARALASKQSKTVALQNAFTKILLILVHQENGIKVTAEIDHGKIDPFAYNAIWDIPSIVVNDVTYEQQDELNDSEEFPNLSLLEIP